MIARPAVAAVVLALAPVLGCAHETLLFRDPVAIASVTPAGGEARVDPTRPITVAFTRPLMPGMEKFAALHLGDVAGSVVEGTWKLSGDRTSLVFAPAAPLLPRTRYTIHVGGGLKAADGAAVVLDAGARMGGQWASSDAAGGAMDAAMTGPGWRAPNGSYGMLFSFTTG